MTSLAFDNVWTPQRRQARRRTQREVLKTTRPKEVPLDAPEQNGLTRVLGQGDEQARPKIILLFGLVAAVHAAVFVALHQPASIEPIVAKSAPLTIEIAPPKQELPPPPPIEPPKPAPRIASIKPAAVPPSMPVVKSTDSVSSSADTVQVATSPAPAGPVPIPAPVAPPAPEPVTEPRGYAGYLNNPAPVYPSVAQRRGLEGRVLLKVHVLASGQPDSVSVAKSSGHDILDEAAVKAVTGWVFEPAKRGQTPIDGWVNVPLNFKLS